MLEEKTHPLLIAYILFLFTYSYKHLLWGLSLVRSFGKYLLYQIQKLNRFIVFRLMWQRGRLGRPLGHLGLVIVMLMVVFMGSFMTTSNVFSDTSLAAILAENSQEETLNEDFLMNLAQASTQIPSDRSEDEIKTYVVQNGDTVSQIAQNYNVTVDTLLAVNGLGIYDFLLPGQELKILPVSGIEHVVEDGDSLESIAEYYGLDNPQPIIEINWLEKPYTVSIGDTLIIPGGVVPAPPQLAAVATAQTYTISAVAPSAPVAGTGQFLWPSPGYISRGYGWFYGYFHGAIDIANNSCGNPIYAADSGYVEVAGWKEGGWGIGVWINHGNGYYSKYAHLSSTIINPGQNVSRGQLIGYSGETGLAYGCHLHFVIERNGVAIDPQAVL